MALLLLLMLLLISGLADVRAGASARPLPTRRAAPRVAPERWQSGLEAAATTREAIQRVATSATPASTGLSLEAPGRACAGFCGDIAVLLERATPLPDEAPGPDHDARGDLVRIRLFPNGAWSLVPRHDAGEEPGAARP
jgi:predicted CDP-diglyceride synthetase/phosphatidate cytidylyltransferase